MELIERAAGDLPMVLLVHIAERHGVGENLVEVGDAVRADFFVEGDGQLCDFAVGLNFAGVLMEMRFGALGAFLDLRVAGTALHFFCSHSGSPLSRADLRFEWAGHTLEGKACARHRSCGAVTLSRKGDTPRQ